MKKKEECVYCGGECGIVCRGLGFGTAGIPEGRVNDPVRPAGASRELNKVQERSASSENPKSMKIRKWRAKYPEKYRKYMREYMKRRREEDK